MEQNEGNGTHTIDGTSEAGGNLQNSIQSDAPPSTLPKPVNSARRPTTRSQTSGKIHRIPENGKEAVQKKPHASSSKRTLDDADPETPEGKPSKSNRKENLMESAPSSSSGTSSMLPGQYTFLAASPSTAVYERRGPRTRTAQPVPVPNLTKKSRGRRVPTKIVAIEKDSSQKPSRLYVCKVEDCGKCFNRGEHLKRHVRSIHTHEKPFKCAHPDCDKYFNRHDNLLQHQKVHKDLVTSDSKSDNHDPPRESPQSPRPSETHEHVFRGVPSRESIIVPPPYTNFRPYHHGPTSPSIGFATNMAVSSLRTELPPSLDPPSGGDSRYYQTGFEPESPLMQHRPFVQGPPLRLPINNREMDQPQPSFYQ